MRKVLLGSTALVAAGLVAGASAPAQAAEPIKLSLGGYYQAFFTLRAQSDVDNEGPRTGETTWGNDETIRHTDVQQEGEVWFVGETTLDNGIKVGVNIQLEAEQSGDQIDEHYVYFSGNFGRLVIGAENAAPYQMHYSAPSAIVGHGLDSPNIWTLVGTSGHANAGSPLATPANLASDANKLTYFTPRFNPGFQFGVSYTPDTTDIPRGGGSNTVTDSEDVGQENVIGFGMNFVRTVGSVDLAWSFGYEHGFVEGNGTAPGVNCNQPGNPASPLVCVTDPDNQQGRDILTTGFNLGFGGWTLGGAFAYDDNGLERDNASYEGVLGVTYGAGPWLFGVQLGGYLNEDGVGDDDTTAAAEVGGTYTLGPGVKVSAGVQGWKGWGDDGNENFDGVAFTMGTGLSF